MTMKPVTAYSSDFHDQKLFPTARSAREAEFDFLMWKISHYVSGGHGLPETMTALAHDLRSGIYPSAIDAFLRAADYLREHRSVLTRAAKDPMEGAWVNSPLPNP